MQELIKVATNAEGKQVVSARDLYHYLGYESNKFSRWAMSKIVKNDFAIVYQDWEGLDIDVQGNKTKDYIVTIDFAKRLAMMAKTEKGEQVRNYFLECEKAAIQNKPKELSRLEVLTLALEAERKVIELQEKIDIDKPKVEFADQILSATNSLDFGTSCKAMNLPFGRNKMFEICRNLGFLMHNNIPYQSHVDNGNFTLLETSFIHPKSGDRVLTTKTMIIPKGQGWLIKNFKKHGFIKEGTSKEGGVS